MIDSVYSNKEKIKLTTPVKFTGPNCKFNSETVVLGIGSCFAQEVLLKLFESGFKGRQNPSGIIYNAVSIAEIIRRIADNQLFEHNEFFEHQGLWHSWEHHGKFSDKTKDSALEKTNKSLLEFREMALECGLFVVTPSSSVVYVFKEEERIVANCHRVPNNLFERTLLSVDENHQALADIVKSVRKLNPECHIVFTLSPVRHYPGELLLNSRSKAHLLTAIYKCLEQNDNVSYFPSYEIVLDELRDYRYYRDDMLHTSDTTVKIIFNRFLDTYFND